MRAHFDFSVRVRIFTNATNEHVSEFGDTDNEFSAHNRYFSVLLVCFYLIFGICGPVSRV